MSNNQSTDSASNAARPETFNPKIFICCGITAGILVFITVAGYAIGCMKGVFCSDDLGVILNNPNTANDNIPNADNSSAFEPDYY